MRRRVGKVRSKRTDSPMIQRSTHHGADQRNPNKHGGQRRASTPICGVEAVDARLCPPYNYLYFTIAAALSASAGEVTRYISSTRAATFSPDTGVISNFAFSASAKKSLSAIVSVNALRSAAARSAGTPGGAI